MYCVEVQQSVTRHQYFELEIEVHRMLPFSRAIETSENAGLKHSVVITHSRT